MRKCVSLTHARVNRVEKNICIGERLKIISQTKSFDEKESRELTIDRSSGETPEILPSVITRRSHTALHYALTIKK